MKTKNEKELEKQVAYRQMLRKVNTTISNLNGIIMSHKKKAYEHERNGNHAKALSEARFIRRIQAIYDKFDSLRSGIELSHEMSDLGKVLVDFSAQCKWITESIGRSVKPGDMINTSALFEEMELKTQSLIDQYNDALPEYADAPAACSGFDSEGETALTDILNEIRSIENRQMLNYTDALLSSKLNSAGINEKF